ncbi:MAG: helix-turn-helix domain-containing protein [Planctomycetaceae bacterium]|nr:helix-turn-helix domain-containing protein [Planctomycetaceae bacterium]
MINHSHPILLLKPTEAAKALAISERTLFTLTKEGKIPVVHIGRSVRYRLSEIEAMLDRVQQGGRSLDS